MNADRPVVVISRGNGIPLGIPVGLVRNGFFQPTNKPDRCSREIRGVYSDPCCRMVVNGKIGLPHWQLLDAVFSSYDSLEEDNAGSFCLSVKKYSIRKMYSRRSLISSRQIHELFMDLMEASVSVTLRDSHSIFSVVDKVKYMAGACEVPPVSRRGRVSAYNASNVEGDLEVPFANSAHDIYIRFGREFSKLIGSGVRVVYNPFEISRLRNGISRSVVRYLYSHQRLPKNGYTMKHLISKYSGQSGVGDGKYKKRELSSDEDAFLELGVSFSSGYISLI